MRRNRRPYPISAYSMCNALGTAEEALPLLAEGASGLTPCALPLPFDTYVGVAKADLAPLPEKWSTYDTRQARLTLHVIDPMREAIAKAVERWGKHRVAVVIGTTTGGIGHTEQAYAQRNADGEMPAGYACLTQHAFRATTDLIALATGITGPRYVVSTACSSSGKVFGSAHRLLEAGLADAVLVGGVDTLCEFTLRGFRSLKILSEERCRPFSETRQGINIGEGGAFVLLEREAEPLAWLRGVGESSDAHHMTRPHPEGAGAASAMRAALAEAGLDASDVDFVNAHGTGTHYNDSAEALAIHTVLPHRPLVLSTKGYTGHLLGACGATEAIFTILALREGWLPPSIGADPVDPLLDIEINREKRTLPLRIGMSNSFAFGGNNVCVLFESAQ